MKFSMALVFNVLIGATLALIVWNLFLQDLVTKDKKPKL